MDKKYLINNFKINLRVRMRNGNVVFVVDSIYL